MLHLQLFHPVLLHLPIQWQYNNGTWVDVADGTPAGATYTNATTATLDVAGITAAANYQYRVIITNCSGGSTITSNAATLAVNALPSVTFTGTLATQCITSTTYALSGGAPVGGSYSGPGVPAPISMPVLPVQDLIQ